MTREKIFVEILRQRVMVTEMENITKTNERIEQEILKAAAKLFAERDYNSVTLKCVASRAGLSEAQVKRIYKNKAGLRDAMYARYRQIHDDAAPGVESLMKAAREVDNPLEVLDLLNYKLPPNEGDFLSQCFLAALRDSHFRSASRDLIKINTINYSADKIKVLLDYLIFLKKIEPLDTGAFSKVVARYTLASATFDKMMRGSSEWINGLEMIFSLIKPIKKSEYS